MPPLPARALPPPPSDDSIQVQVTPPGEGAIATFILDGKDALALLKKSLISKIDPAPHPTGQLLLGRLIDARGDVIDEVIAAPRSADESETGFDQVELSCHGGVGATEAVREALGESGFRPGCPWELEVRAHRAARLSLLSLEARMRMACAHTFRQMELLLAHSRTQEQWERYGLEAALGTRTKSLDWREQLYVSSKAILDRSGASMNLLRTHKVAVVGPVNAGKSTLVNRLLRSEESIVSSIPGTTRDRLARPAVLRGLSIELVDSAGLRDLGVAEGADADIEKEGQKRALAAAGQADLVLIVIDASTPPSTAQIDAVHDLGQKSHLLVLNKSDLGVHPEVQGLAFSLESEPVTVSALTGQGLNELEHGVEERLLEGPSPGVGTAFTRRQIHHIETLHAGLINGSEGSTIVNTIRALIGTRPNEAELASVFQEAGLK